LTTQQMTVVSKVWVSAVQQAGIVQKADTSYSGFIFGWDGNGALQGQVLGNFGNMTVATAGNAIVPGQWMQVAFTWDGTQGGPASAAHLYINGIEQTKVTAQNGSDIHYQGATNQPFQIGNAARFLPGSLNGKMAYLAVYKGRMLTSTELNQLDAQLPVLTGPVMTGTLVPNGSATTMQTIVSGTPVKLGFTGSANQQAIIQLSGNTMGAVTASLLKPDGASLLSTSSSATNFTV